MFCSSIVSKFKLNNNSLKSFSQIFRIKYEFSFDCNNCSKKIHIPQCNVCHRMVNYFQIFNIPQSYKVNQKDISIKAKQLQKKYHPDKHSFNSQLQQIFKLNMIKYSAYINQAKATLLDDLRRAIYLMQLKGFDIQQNTQIHDNKFMAEIFTLQEQIQDADKQTCQQIKNRIQAIMKKLQLQFDNFFKSQNMEKCKQFIFKYKYLHRALTNINKKLNSIQLFSNQ